MSRVIEQRRGLSWSGLGHAGRFLWEVVSLPFWLGSTMPPPGVPGRRESAGVTGERTPQILRQLDELRATIWRQRRAILLFRAAWLALAVVNVWLLLRVVAHQDRALLPFLLGALVLLAAGAGLIATARPTRGQLARTLDRSFGLRERVATAYESAEEGKRIGGVRALQVVEATRLAKQMGAATAFQPRRPTREIVLTAAMALLAIGLLIALLIQRIDGPGGAGNVPGQNQGANGAAGSEPQSSQGAQPGNQPGNQPSGQNGQGTQPGQQPGNQPGNQPSAQGQADLDTLGGALADHGATRQAANQIANGNYQGAAAALREAGQQASSQSPQARQELAEDLREAANQVSDPQLAEHLREAANALQRPSATGAEGAFDNLAEDVERLGEGQSPSGQGGDQGQGQGNTPGGPGGSGANGGGQGGQAPQLPSSQRTQPSLGQPTDPLGTNGQPIELPKGSGSNATVNTQNQGGTGTSPAGQGAAAAGGGQVRQGNVGDAGSDPNTVPYDQRGTVQQYFTPPGDGDER